MAMSLFGTDPFGMLNDPFFADPFGFGLAPVTTGRRRRGRRGTGGGSTPTTTTSLTQFPTTLTQAANDADCDMGHWHFDYFLSEPVQLELEEFPKQYIARVYHPGVTKEKLKLDVENDTLIISGEYETGKEQEEKSKHEEPLTRQQPRRVFKRFVRYMVLPDDVDQTKIAAHHKGEYLEICIKKTEGAQQRQQRIPIK